MAEAPSIEVAAAAAAVAVVVVVVSLLRRCCCFESQSERESTPESEQTQSDTDQRVDRGPCIVAALLPLV